MITKTINLDSSYQSLFDEIRDKSNGDIDINNIEGFFGNIQAIASLDKKFLRLPLEEPMFEIDADSRRITVPDAFRINGLSVQGDHLAEIVFFSIDRYFDYTDLSSTDITINWKMGSNVGKTKNFIMSNDIIPGHIVFGWPINNVITEKSGSLSFAVEFCKKDSNTGEVVYDLNTLAAAITIRDGLVIDENTEVTSLDDDIISILTDSVFGEGDAAVGPISWVSGNGHGLVRGNVMGPSGALSLSEYQNPIYLDTIIDRTSGNPSSASISLYGQAYVDKGTEILYTDNTNQTLDTIMVPITLSLEKVLDLTNLDSNNKYFSANRPDAGIDFEEAELIAEENGDLWVMKALDNNLIYYVAVPDSDPIAYIEATDEQIQNFGNDDSDALYLKMVSISINEKGTYTVRAQGIKKDSNGKKIGNGEILVCEPIEVPAVEVPTKINIEKSEISLETDAGYDIDPNTSSNVVFLNSNNEATLTAQAEVEHYGALKFVWKQKNNSGNFINIFDNDKFVVDLNSPMGDSISANNSILEIDEPGEYQVRVFNFQNGETSTPVDSEVYVASKLASKITTATCKAGGVAVGEIVNFNSQDSSMARRSVTLSIEDVTKDGELGDLSYEWYTLDENDNEVNKIGTSQSITLNAEGSYLPVVKNIYNGSIFTYKLSKVYVNDRANS